jgi:hypothetical protein
MMIETITKHMTRFSTKNHEKEEKIMTAKRSFFTTGVYLALVFILVACARAAPRSDTVPGTGAADDELITYVGDVDGDIFIAVDMIELEGAEQERAIRAYVCDGADVSIWMTGQFSGDEVTLASGDHRIVLTRLNSVSGTLSLAGGDEVPFTAERATGEAGLYRTETTFEGMDYIGGWIILNNGQQRGALTLGGQVLENPTLDTSTGEVETSLGTLSTVRCFRNPFTGERICRAFN